MTQQAPIQPPQLAPTLYIPGEVRSCAAVSGRDGPQWLIEIAVDFSQYPLKLYIEQADYPEPIQPGLYPHCTFERGRLISSDRDPAIDYNWRWRLTSFNAEAAAEATNGAVIQQPAAEGQPQLEPAPAPQPTPVPAAEAGEITARDDHPAKRQSIERGTADYIRADVLKAAGNLVIAEMNYTQDLERKDWQGRAAEWYATLMAIPEWGEVLRRGTGGA